jgi:hypothetical protein
VPPLPALLLHLLQPPPLLLLLPQGCYCTMFAALLALISSIRPPGLAVRLAACTTIIITTVRQQGQVSSHAFSNEDVATGRQALLNQNACK